jgi:YHS domain-containing protein
VSGIFGILRQNSSLSGNGHSLAAKRGDRYVTTNEGEMKMKTTTTVKDPVCGMDIETAAAGRAEFKGQTYYFCGPKCKEKFDLKPEQYLGKSAGAPKSGHGCCG